MPRIKQYEERYAMDDFMAEVNAQRARYGYDTQEKLGPVIGVCQSTAGNYMRDPMKIPFGVLRLLVKAVKPDPGVLLKALGYTTQDIKKLAKEYA